MKRFALVLFLLGAVVLTADAQLLRRGRGTVVVPSAVADPPAAKAPESAAPKLHPIVSLFIRQHVIAGLVEKGMPRAKARKIADDHLTDEFLAAGLNDHGLKMPAAPPAGGWLAWLMANLPAILDMIAKLIALFGV